MTARTKRGRERAAAAAAEPDPVDSTALAAAEQWADSATGRRGRRRDRRPRVPPPSPDLQTLLASIVGSGAEKLELSRYNEVNGVAYYVTEVAISSFSLEWVKQHLGGGRFRLAAWGFAADGRKGLVAPPIDFAIEGMPRSFTDPTTGQIVGQPTPGAAGTMSPQEAANTALATLVTSMTTSVAAMSKAMMQMSDGGGKRGDDLERFIVLKNLLDDGKSKGNSLTEQIELYRAFREAAAEFAPQGSGNPMIDALREGVSTVKPVAEAIAQKIRDGAPARPAPPQARVPATVVETPTQSTAQPAGAEVPEVASIDDYLREVSGYLVEKAQRGVNPSRVAVRIVEEIEEDHPLWYAAMQQQARTNPRFVDDLVARFAGLPAFAGADATMIEWLRSVASVAQEELAAVESTEEVETVEEEDEEQPTPEGRKK